MIKTMGILIIILSSTALGFMLAENIKKRYIQLKELQAAVFQLQNEVFYTRTELPEAFRRVGDKCKFPINNLFNNVSRMLVENEINSVYEAFDYSMDKDKNLYITNEDKDILLNLARSLGESDLEGHRNSFELTNNDLKYRIEEVNMKLNKDKKMYRYLGFSFGAVVAILLI
ncbi:stage III sporulation protein AB [Clostridium sp. 19966]|uniref:stage III sporulation protein SpoIIIAB n=1 Tax=Clostridium sp. 19966 TaxID=2768166 RepID=UPI0028DD6F39|nr:stage III sporulation protein SpoIIIAB [Clostridium sp. 19966]MDT8716588.1 stage III sporulation protein AB [Clostridium sp. 19966]